jgi:Tol biopolymer transport system component
MTVGFRCRLVAAVLAVTTASCGYYVPVDVVLPGEPGPRPTVPAVLGASAVSHDGSEVVLVTEGPDGELGLFVRDLVAGSVEPVTVDGSGQPLEGELAFGDGVISADGHFVAFAVDDPIGPTQGWVHDRDTGTSVRFDERHDGSFSDAGGILFSPDISADGRYVVFTSTDRLLLPPGPDGLPVLDGQPQVFRRDLTSGALDLVSATPTGEPGDGTSLYPVVDGDGSRVVFTTYSGNLVGRDVAGGSLMVWDSDRNGVGELSIAADGEPGDDHTFAASITDDGGEVLVYTEASNLPGGSTGSNFSAFIIDIDGDSTHGIGPVPEAVVVDFPLLRGQPLSMSGDGSRIAFPSSVALAEGAPPGLYVLDRQTGRVQFAATDGLRRPFENAFAPRLSGNGAYLAFGTGGADLDTGDFHAHVRAAAFPEIDSVAPATISPDQTGTYTIEGAFFGEAPVVSEASPAVSVEEVVSVSPTSIVVVLRATGDLEPGPVPLHVNVGGLLGSSVAGCGDCLHAP